MNFGGTLQDAVALVKSGHLEQAVEEWTQAVDASTLRDRFLMLGDACGGLGRRQEGLEFVLKALNLDAQDVRCLCAAGEAYQSCELLDKAMQCFFKATQLAAPVAAAWSGMGYVFLRKNKPMSESDS